MTKWEQKLLRISDILDDWMRCQRMFVDLEPVFANDEIVNKLAQEARRYVPSCVMMMVVVVGGNSSTALTASK